MTTRFDAEDNADGTTGDGQEDPLVELLRPPASHLAAPQGHFTALRRKSRRRRARTVLATAAACTAAFLIALPLTSTSHPPAHESPPLAPPPATISPAPSPARDTEKPSPTPTPVDETASPTLAPPDHQLPTPSPSVDSGTKESAAKEPETKESMAPSAVPSPASDPTTAP
ncbi:hypothetical protein IAG44_22535 [Streptomyces roseirectus]|uniref:Uncharacterized protein n=1 Tax=Streptomyces roseirectus TaxID=2768066 RepID=A0A7H0IGJ9_9ACTN|nr:hypothetical protein [Streptomyces roseirectus]QNP71915.1 hypothetical protein IAG44_22535 [Streptomyces roseirectus]